MNDEAQKRLAQLQEVLDAIDTVVDHFGEDSHAQVRLMLQRVRDIAHEEQQDINRAIEVLGRLLKKQERLVPPRRNVPAHVAAKGRPENLPTNFEMISAILKDHPEGLGAGDLLGEMKVRFWSEFPASTTASFYDFATRGKLVRSPDKKRFMLPPAPVQGAARDNVLAAKRAASSIVGAGPRLAQHPALTYPHRTFEHAGKEVALSVHEWRLVSKLYPKLGSGLMFGVDVLADAVWTHGDRKPPSVRDEMSRLKASVNPKLAVVQLSLESTPIGYYLKEVAA